MLCMCLALMSMCTIKCKSFNIITLLCLFMPLLNSGRIHILHKVTCRTRVSLILPCVTPPDLSVGAALPPGDSPRVFCSKLVMFHLLDNLLSSGRYVVSYSAAATCIYVGNSIIME